MSLPGRSSPTLSPITYADICRQAQMNREELNLSVFGLSNDQRLAESHFTHFISIPHLQYNGHDAHASYITFQVQPAMHNGIHTALSYKFIKKY